MDYLEGRCVCGFLRERIEGLKNQSETSRRDLRERFSIVVVKEFSFFMELLVKS